MGYMTLVFFYKSTGHIFKAYLPTIFLQRDITTTIFLHEGDK